MATSDTKTGFRLPWSSDRPQDDPAVEDAPDGTPGSAAAQAAPDATWPAADVAADPGSEGWPPAADDAGPALEAAAARSLLEAPSVTVELHPPASRRPSKLMADLAAAIRATTESARDQRLSQLDADAAGIVDMIRAQSEEGSVRLRRRSDEDVTAIRDWAKAEIARVKDESETRIADRRRLLEREVADHAAAIEDRCAEVHIAVGGYRQAMDAYFERLVAEEDPARLATLAEAMPDPPTLEALSDLTDLAPAEAAARRAADAEAAALDAALASAGTPPQDDHDGAPLGPAVAEQAHDGSETEGGGDIFVSEARIANALGRLAADQAGAAEPTPPTADSPAASGGSTMRWTASDAPRAFTGRTETSDREAILAAAEAAAESDHHTASGGDADPDQGLAAVADTEPVASEPEAGARPADRTAPLPDGEGPAEPTPQMTQVVVSGLVSVASIASFKRHLGRVAGVSGVAVASGPDGEFIFNATHHLDTSLRDAIPTLPGFAARVVAMGDGVLNVTARDPETEG